MKTECKLHCSAEGDEQADKLLDINKVRERLIIGLVLRRLLLGVMLVEEMYY